MVGTGVAALDDTVRLTRAACELGFAGALVLPPFFYPQVPDDGLVAYVEALARRVDRPNLAIYLYHIPQNTQVPWPIEVVVRLRERLGATLVGLKDSAGDLAYARAVVAAVPGFDVFPSSEAALGSATADGFAGCISATVNLTAPLAQSAWARAGHPGRCGRRSQSRRPARDPVGASADRRGQGRAGQPLRRPGVGARGAAAAAARGRACRAAARGARAACRRALTR